MLPALSPLSAIRTLLLACAVLALGVAAETDHSPKAERVAEHAQALAAFGDRSPGSEGATKAAAYISAQLEQMGGELWQQQTSLIVPSDKGSFLSVGDDSFTLTPHHPNAFATAGTAGETLRGRLVFVGRGSTEDLAGKKLDGTIVVLESNSEDAWIRCAQLGAIAAIFVSPDKLDGVNFKAQVLNASLAFPRFIIESLPAELNGTEASLTSTVSLETKQALTVVARFKGTNTNKQRDAVMLASGYESSGAIPDASPGATRAWNAALLLSIAEQFAQQPLNRDLLVVFHGARPELFRGLRQLLAGITDPDRRLSVNSIGQEVPLGDFLKSELEREAWRATEAGADLQAYLDFHNNGETKTEAWLNEKLRELTVVPVELQANSGTSDNADDADAGTVAEEESAPFLSLTQIIVIILLTIGLAAVVQRRITTGTPEVRSVNFVIMSYVLLLVWIFMSRPESTAALKAGELEKEQDRIEELGQRFIAEEAARKADALRTDLRKLSLRYYSKDKLQLPEDEVKVLKEELDQVEAEHQLWRNIQQKLGKKELEENELRLLPGLIANIVGEGEESGSLDRHLSILNDRINDIESSIAIRNGLSDTRVLHAVSIDFTDGNTHFSTQLLGPWVAFKDRLNALTNSVKRLAVEVGEGGVPVNYDPSPYVSGGEPTAWWPEGYLHESGVIGLFTNAMTFSTVNDLRIKVGSPADRFEVFNAENFLAQSTGLTHFLRQHFNGEDINRALAARKVTFKPGIVRVETPSEGSTTGRKGYPYPLIEMRVGKNDSLFYGGVRAVETHWGDAFGEIAIPWVPERPPKGGYGQMFIEVAGLSDEGKLTQVVSSSGTQAKSGTNDRSWSFRGNLKDLKPVMFDAESSYLFGIYDPRLLMPLSKVTVLSASRDATPDFAHVEVDRGNAAVFAAEGTELRVLASEGAIGNRLVLLGTPENAEFKDFDGLPPGALSTLTALDTAEDMWQLNEGRLKELRDNGVNPESLLFLHSESERHLKAAKEALAAGEIDTAEGSSQAAWSFAGRVYPAVLTTANDVVYGLVVMLIFAIPFAVICERLFIAGNTIFKKIGGFALFFAATFMFFFFFHPAFALATTPVIIFLAFAIIVMSFLVIVIIFSRFEHEMEMIRMAGLGLHKVDVSRLGTLLATVTLGISNMRRRPLRTFLTGITVVLMTFILLTFASFNSSSSTRRITDDTPPSWQGIMVRQSGWVALNEQAAKRITNTWGDQLTIHTRRWLAPEATRAKFAFNNGTNSSYIEGVIGVEDNDPSGIDAALIRPEGMENNTDRWIYMPKEVISQGKLSVGDTMYFQGVALKLGLLDTAALGGVTTIDGGQFTPLALETLTDEQKDAQEKALAEAASGEVAVESGSFTHLSPSTVAVTDAETCRLLGGTIRSLALQAQNETVAMDEIAEDMAHQLAISLRVGDGSESYLLTAVGKLSVAGLSDVLIPLILGGMIIFSTMLGSVAERGKEIFIYASLGLAPIHIGALFLVEASIYAVLGGLGGYMLAQLIIAGLGFMADLGIGVQPDLNYSSFTAVVTILLVMATVLISALYPALVASRAANPGADTSFRVPEPEGDDLEIDFPFTVARRDVRGLLAYLHNYLEAHTEASTGCFTAADAVLTIDDTTLEVTSKTWLAPFDLGISQRFTIEAQQTDVKAIYGIHISLHLLSGQRSAWRRVTIPFLKDLRQQFLVWRTLDDGTTDRYRALGGDTDAAERIAERQRQIELEKAQEEAERSALKDAMKDKGKLHTEGGAQA